MSELDFPFSENYYRLVFEEAFDPILITDETGKILRANRQLALKFGYEPQELLGQALEALMPARFRNRHASQRSAFIKAPMARAMGEDSQLLGLKKDGTEFPIQISLSYFSDSEKNRIVAILRDISGRKRIENQNAFLAKIGDSLSYTMSCQERIQRVADAAVEALADACIISTLEGTSQKFRAVAVRSEEMRPYLETLASHVEPNQNKDYLLAHSIENLQTTLVSDVTPEFLRDEKTEPLLREQMTRMAVKSYLVVPMISNGKAIGTIVLLMTNSGRKFQTEDLGFFELVAGRCAVAVENAKLYLETTEAVSSRELVLSIVSHDLRNPVATINLSIEMLKSSKLLAESGQLKVIDKIQNATLMMEKLIADLLDFRRAQAGTFTLERAPTSVSMLIQDSIDTMTERLNGKRIRLAIDCSPTLKAISADRRRLIQVLWNILGNAIKFTPEDGEIKISAKLVGDSICLTVTDSGPGLRTEELPKVFDRFWQAAKSADLGLGLGLTIAKGIVEAHLGKIWVNSEIGHGCSFSFTIPCEACLAVT